MQHLDHMTEADLAYYFDIPPAFDRRGQKPNRRLTFTAPTRKWVMPSPKRIAAMKRKRTKEDRAIERARQKDLKAAAPDDIVDTAADLTKVNR